MREIPVSVNTGDARGWYIWGTVVVYQSGECVLFWDETSKEFSSLEAVCSYLCMFARIAEVRVGRRTIVNMAGTLPEQIERLCLKGEIK